jgi:outer membrane protein assembly factor BamB
MYSLDPSTGETNWEYSTSGTFRKDPIIHNGLIYIPVQGGPNGLLAINESTGQLEWQVDFPDWGDSSPAIYEDAYDGVVYVGDKAGNIRSIDLSTGDTNWLYSSGVRIRGAVSITQDGIYFGSNTGYVYHINHDGDFLWKYEVGGAITSAPWVKDAVWNITEGGVYTAPNIGP